MKKTLESEYSRGWIDGKNHTIEFYEELNEFERITQCLIIKCLVELK